ncbi:MAG: hypothetical protein JSV52_08620 [Candidatus Zixiibacteriota bacterium]|nr:MAG: hypothetical protein JSV52_08620 [candidate division Zixibacteria bacterium]
MTTSSAEHFFVQLLGTRDNWPNDMTPDEEKIMTDHFYYLKDLVEQKKVLVAGPVFEPVFGLIIVRAESKAEARAIVEKDPSVVHGLHTFKISPMRVSLLAERGSEEKP